MLVVCHPKILHKHCLQFLLGVKMTPRETENFKVTNKEHYGMKLWIYENHMQDLEYPRGIHNFIIILSRVYHEPIQRPAPSWLVSLIGRALHRYRRGQGFESRTSLNFFQAFFSQLHKLSIQLRWSSFKLNIMVCYGIFCWRSIARKSFSYYK